MVTNRRAGTPHCLQKRAIAGLALQSQAILSVDVPPIIRLKQLLTMLAHCVLWENRLSNRGLAMDYDNDRYLLVRAELSDLLEALRLTSFDSNPVQFLMRLDAIRQKAVEHRFAAVAEIAAVYEAAMQRVITSGGSDSVTRNFTGILNDAIGCAQLGPEVAHGLLASIATRLRQ